MSSDGTTADLHEYCEDDSPYGDGRIDYTRITKFESRECAHSDASNRSSRSRCPDISYFASVITPLTELNGFSEIGGCVEFRMRRKNKTVTLQWEPFSGVLTHNGVSHLTVAQNITNTPPYTMTYLIPIVHRGVTKITKLVIDPFLTRGNILFYLNLDGSSTDTFANDTIKIDGGAVNWVVD